MNKKIHIPVRGMKCASCAATIEKASKERTSTLLLKKFKRR